MAEIEQGKRAPCPRCGNFVTSAPCTFCGGASRPDLRVLPPLPRATGPASEQHLVRLVRECKGPTVRDLLAAGAPLLDRLPGRVHAAERALRRGDLAAADRELGTVLANLHAGPGAWRRRFWNGWRVVLVLWAAFFLAVLALLALRFE